jgi:hypothetical protein
VQKLLNLQDLSTLTLVEHSRSLWWSDSAKITLTLVDNPIIKNL